MLVSCCCIISVHHLLVQVTIGPETVMTTLYAAKKYAVPALESHCVDFLKKNLSPDNSFMLLTQARLFDEPQLAALCLETIGKSLKLDDLLRQLLFCLLMNENPAMP